MENSSQSSTNPISQGCGPNTQINVHVSPTTGGDFYLSVESDISIENLKKLISKRLKVPRDRICLLFRDKQLQDGNLVQHGISDGSRITLLPNVETGLITQRPEIGIMQALESLNDTQVNEFLCGKAPLNLSMRLGDHMMLIQLQLSTVSGVKPPNSPTPASPTPSSSSSSTTIPGTCTTVPQSANPPTNPPSLLQASRNLQHTLRRLSADVFSGKDRGRRESVYSGTFSGALNPALQDPKGRPRRDVATIVHILNDLLCSVPELRRVTRKGSEEPTAHVPVEQQDEPMITTSCSEDQNLRTRGKLEHLRLVMGERRERRRQRKQKPYSLPQSDTDTVTA
ncbi:midnolin homolog [Diabrotica virgifera virgifera]|uniref:Ubiquitin-like domain-containing protein n=1 Tax=Diabrotica virgifera virgifera TaxID=50390 RepID=A0ABM5JP12_DIAVI|nr:midnolin homolog [Diabrotica virgifera virgifera]